MVRIATSRTLWTSKPPASASPGLTPGFAGECPGQTSGHNTLAASFHGGLVIGFFAEVRPPISPPALRCRGAREVF